MGTQSMRDDFEYLSLYIGGMVKILLFIVCLYCI